MEGPLTHTSISFSVKRRERGKRRKAYYHINSKGERKYEKEEGKERRGSSLIQAIYIQRGGKKKSH